MSQDSTAYLLDQLQYFREQTAEFEASDPNDSKRARSAIIVVRHHAIDSTEFRRLADGGLWGPDELSQIDIGRAKQLVKAEHEHFRAAVRFLTAFGASHGIDASPLIDGQQDETLLLRLEAAIQTALHARPTVGNDSKLAMAVSDAGMDVGAGEKNNRLEQMRPAHRLAYLAATFAEQTAGRTLTDKEAWDWVQNYPGEWPEELRRYEPPAVDTFSTYLTKARRLTGERRKQPRSGRSGGSVKRWSEL